MAVILTTRQPWLRRPSGLVTLNWASPLARGLAAFYRCDASDGWTIRGGARFNGEGAFVDAQTSGFTRTDTGAWWATATALTYHIIAHWPASAFVWTGSVLRHEGCYSLQLHSSGVLRGVYWPTSGTGSIAHIGTAATNALYGQRDLAITMTVDQVDSTVPRIYVAGVAQTMTTSGSVGTRAPTYRVGLGARPDAEGGNEGMAGATYRLAAVWARALSPAEVWALYDPRTRWELYQPLVRRVYFDVGGGGGPTYTLTCDAGSYSLTGTDATLTVGRTIDCDAGSYAVTGTDAALTVGRTIVAEAGSYTVAGTDADLTVGRTISADAGTYTLTGTDAGLTVARVLDAASGTYTLTGTAADLDYSGAGGPTYTLAADAGTYALSGTAATLTVSRTISAEAGTYTLTGTDATLAFTRLLTAEAGTYTLTGTDAALIASRALGADAGVYALTGTAAALTYSGAAPDLAAEADTWRARARPTAWRAKARPTAWKAKP